jgi:hypothetical protein
LSEHVTEMVSNVLVHQSAKGIVVDIEAIEAEHGEAVGQQAGAAEVEQ